MEEIISKKRMLLKKYLDENNLNNGTLFTQNQDAMLAIDLGGNIVQANSAFEKLTGYSYEYYNQVTFQTLIVNESVDKVLNHLQKTAKGKFENYDCKMKSLGGNIFDLNVTNIPIIVDGQIVGMYVVLKDITQLKRKKREARQIEEYQHLLTDNILDLIISTNLIGGILYVSPSCKNVLGYAPDEIIGQYFSLFLHEDDKERYSLEQRELLTELKYNRGSYRFRKKDGSFIWIESSSNPIIDPDTRNILEVVSVIRDITERKRAEEDLWSRERAFRNLVEHSPDAVVIANNEEILFINETGIRLLGVSTDQDILSKSLLDFVHPDYHQIAKERIKTIHNGEITEFLEYKIIKLDGTIIDAEIKGIPTFFRNQPAQHIIVRDITDRKKTQAHLINSEKLSIAGQLAAGIAHEVRNPLTAIKGFLQLMENQIDRRYYDIIDSEMERIELILSELLVLAKPQDIIFKTENIISLIVDVKMLIDTQAIMNNVQTEIIYDSGNWDISCDKNQLKQVFINFLKNAIEAMPNGGSITIEIKKVCAEKIKIFIKDTGTGIPYHILKRIGEPFITNKENGTGLGLMISKQIIENHRGTVHFWSDNKGTIIEVILPLN